MPYCLGVQWEKVQAEVRVGGSTEYIWSFLLNSYNSTNLVGILKSLSSFLSPLEC